MLRRCDERKASGAAQPSRRCGGRRTWRSDAGQMRLLPNAVHGVISDMDGLLLDTERSMSQLCVSFCRLLRSHRTVGARGGILRSPGCRIDFQIVVTRDLVARNKPSPDRFIEAARALDAHPKPGGSDLDPSLNSLG